MNARVSNTWPSPRSVNQRPRSITVIGCLFIAAGVFGLAYHAGELSNPFQYDVLWVLVLRLLAIVGGVFVLTGASWARWLLLGWLAYHVMLSAWHSASELVVHSVLLAAIGYGLLRPQASAYFRGPR